MAIGQRNDVLWKFLLGILGFWSSLAVCVSGDNLAKDFATIEEAIDDHIRIKQQEMSVVPAPQVDATTLLRRLMLDLCGRIPSPAEISEFVNEDPEHRRREWIDQLMDSPGFVRHQTDELESLLMYPDGGNLRDYLKKSVLANRRWDQIFKDLMLPDQGDDPNASAAAFLKSRLKDADKLTNEVSVRFFGVNVSCAQCHDHPLVRDWKQDHYFGMKSFFSRTFESGGFLAEREYGLVDYSTTKGVQKRAQLMFLTGEVLEEPEYREPSDQEKQSEKKRLEELKNRKKAPEAPNYSRRSRVIEAGLSPTGKFWMARSIVNRVWYRLIGYGFVMPLDQLHSENPASHPELLDWLASDLVAHDFDLRRLIRGIVSSQTYSLSSSLALSDKESSGTKRPDNNLFAVARPRLLTPYQMGASLKVAMLDPDSIGPAILPSLRSKRLEDAAQAGRGLSNRFEMPREDLQISVSEALFLSNNKQFDSEVKGSGLVHRLMQSSSEADRIRIAMRSVLLRDPSEEEMQLLFEFLKDRNGTSQQANQLLIWSLLTCSEFRFCY